MGPQGSSLPIRSVILFQSILINHNFEIISLRPLTKLIMIDKYNIFLEAEKFTWMDFLIFVLQSSLLLYRQENKR